MGNLFRHSLLNLLVEIVWEEAPVNLCRDVFQFLCAVVTWRGMLAHGPQPKVGFSFVGGVQRSPVPTLTLTQTYSSMVDLYHG
jgi:hypothetical protein